MAAKAALIVCTIDQLIDACERRDHLRAFRQNLIIGWLKQGNQEMEMLGAISVYIVEHGITDRVVNVIQEVITDPHFNGFDLVNAVHTLREERRLAVCMGWHPRLGADSTLNRICIYCLAGYIV